MKFAKTRRLHKPLKAARKTGQVLKRVARLLRRVTPLLAWLGHKLSFLGFLDPRRYIKRLDRYIIKKFIGTYFYAIALIISVSIVFDVNENLAKFSEYHAPL